MDLQSVTETQDNIEAPLPVVMNEAGSSAAIETNTTAVGETKAEEEDEDEDDDDEYELSDEAKEKAARAAEAQARIEQFLAMKKQRRMSEQTLLKPKSVPPSNRRQ
jgi:hypothetical protein